MSQMPPPTIPPATPPPPGGGAYTPPPPPPPGRPDASDRSLMVVLAYLGPAALVPYLTKKDDPDIHWHARNGLALFVAEVALFVLLFIIDWLVPYIGCFVWAIQCIIPIGLLILHVFAIVKAFNYQRLRIPMISDFADKM